MALYDDARAAWTSYVPSGRVRIAPATRDGVRWHWAGPAVGLAGKSHAACLSQVKGWEAYHRSKGWNSIGYNALVCVHARVIEGRGIDYRGAHSGSEADNAATYGVQFMVGEGETVTAVMFDRATRLERDLWDHSGHTLTSSGHRDAPGAATACPGPQIYRWAHTAHTTTPQEDDDMPYRDWPAEDRAALAADVAREVHNRSLRAGLIQETMAEALGRTSARVRAMAAEPDPVTRDELLAALDGLELAGATAEQIVDALAARLTGGAP